MNTQSIQTTDPLTMEFERLCGQHEGAELLKQWQRVEPALADVRGIGDIPRALAAHAHADTKDAILLALIRRAQHGDARPASICILAVLRPKLRSMAARVQPDSPAIFGLSRRDIVCALQSAMFEEILRYRTERWTRKVAATLALNTLHAITERREASTPTCPDTTVDIDTWRAHPVRTFATWSAADPLSRRPVRTDWAHPIPGAPVTNLYGNSEANAGTERDLPHGHTPTRDTEILQTLAWAVRVGAITQHDARLLHDLYLGTRPYAHAVHAAATESGRTTAAIRQRCSRATRAIAAAVRQADDDLAVAA